jgi:hypothetical protein
MTTKPPAEVKYYDDNTLIKKLYNSIEELKDIIIVPNDRNRLSFCLNMYINKEVGSILEAVIQANPRSSSIKYPELAKIIEEKFREKGILPKE